MPVRFAGRRRGPGGRDDMDRSTGYLLRGLAAAVPFVYTGTDEEKHIVAYGRLVCGVAGSALLSVPLLWLFTGHRWLAAFSAPFLLVVVAALVPRLDMPGYLLYALTG